MTGERYRAYLTRDDLMMLFKHKLKTMSTSDVIDFVLEVFDIDKSRVINEARTEIMKRIMLERVASNAKMDGDSTVVTPEIKLPQLQGYKLYDPNTSLFACKGLKIWSATGKTWGNIAHLKSALTNVYGPVDANRRYYYHKDPSYLTTLIVIDLVTGTKMSAHELWAREPKK